MRATRLHLEAQRLVSDGEREQGAAAAARSGSAGGAARDACRATTTYGGIVEDGYQLLKLHNVEARALLFPCAFVGAILSIPSVVGSRNNNRS